MFTKMVWLLEGNAEHHSGMMALQVFAEDRHVGCDYYKSSLKVTMGGFGGHQALLRTSSLVVATVWAEDHRCAVVATEVG